MDAAKVNGISDAIRERELLEPSILPDIRGGGNEVLVAWDIGGDHREAS